MRKALALLLLIPFFAAFREASGQMAMKMPELITRAEKRVNINGLLSKSGVQLEQPWVIYSDRDQGYDHFGEKFYVVEERATEVHVYKASGCRDRKLIRPEDRGWKRKADLFMTFGADFTRNSLIHKKCVILNHHGTIERIKRGEISESEAPLYRSPQAGKSPDHVPLYLIYFVYKTENDRYLLGKDYRFDPDLPFSEQVIGWVDRERVFDYNNRICFEPSSVEEDVCRRRCDPALAARVFETEQGLGRFLGGNITEPALWVEPEYYFFRDPNPKKSNEGARDLGERDFNPDFITKLCALDGTEESLKKSGLLTGQPLPGNKFRFPLIRTDKPGSGIFVTGVTGRFENDLHAKRQLCQALRANKSQVTVYFILDNTVDRNRLSYVIGQIQQEYTGLKKSFGACFYPRPRIGKFRLAPGEKGSGPEQDNYRYTRDFIRDFKSQPGFESNTDNALGMLRYVLDNEPFDPGHTNIVVLVNNRPVMGSDSIFSDIREDVSRQMAEKNIFLLAFDYRCDRNLLQHIREISTGAGRRYAGRLGLSDTKIAFERTGDGYELKNACLLSFLEQADSAKLAAAEMQAFLQQGYGRIITTLNTAIDKICEQDKGVPAETHEDPFSLALKELPGAAGNIQYIRALEEGYAAIRYNLPGGDYRRDIWKANVLMTKPELEMLGTLLDKMSVQGTNSAFSRSLYDLWCALFNRFVGDNLSTAELLPMTPEEIMNRILGESWGYSVADPLKRFPLERILANDQAIQKYYDGYRIRLTECSRGIREILATGRLRFSLTDDAEGANQPASRKGIYYYWVPMEVLP